MCGRFYVPEKEMDDFTKLVAEVERSLLKNTVRFIEILVPEITRRQKEEGTNAVNGAFRLGRVAG